MDNFHNVQDGKGGRKLVPFTAEEDAALAVRVAERTVEREKYDSLKYQRDRKAAYPDIGDQLDAIWKQMAADKAAGKSLDAATDDALTAVLKVKSDFAKPG
jgi:hypothetical protein